MHPIPYDAQSRKWCVVVDDVVIDQYDTYIKAFSRYKAMAA